MREEREDQGVLLFFPKKPHWFFKRGNSAASPIYHTKSEAYGGVDNKTLILTIMILSIVSITYNNLSGLQKTSSRRIHCQ